MSSAADSTATGTAAASAPECRVMPDPQEAFELPFADMSYAPYGDLHTHSPFVSSMSATILAAAKLLHVQETDTVCDLGCGDGSVLNTILDHYRGVRALGLDIEPDLIAAARAKALELGVAERAQFEVSDFFNAEPHAIVARISKVYLYIVERQLADPRLRALLVR